MGGLFENDATERAKQCVYNALGVPSCILGGTGTVGFGVGEKISATM